MIYDNPAQKAWMEAERLQEAENRRDLDEALERRRQKSRDDARDSRRNDIRVEIWGAARESGYHPTEGLDEFLVCLLERLDRR